MLTYEMQSLCTHLSERKAVSTGKKLDRWLFLPLNGEKKKEKIALKIRKSKHFSPNPYPSKREIIPKK